MFPMDVTKWLELQLSDANFPVGAFTHSHGLESASANELLNDPDALKRGILEMLKNLKSSQLPYLPAIYLNPDEFLEIDQHCDSSMLNHIANQASRTQGQNMLSACQKIFPNHSLKELYKECLAENRPTHLAPTYAVICRELGITLKACIEIFIFNTAKAMYSAAVRLNLVGPLKAQQQLYECHGVCAALLEGTEQLSLDDVHACLPLADLSQAAHDRLYSRLFQS